MIFKRISTIFPIIDVATIVTLTPYFASRVSCVIATGMDSFKNNPNPNNRIANSVIVGGRKLIVKNGGSVSNAMCVPCLETTLREIGREKEALQVDL